LIIIRKEEEKEEEEEAVLYACACALRGEWRREGAVTVAREVSDETYVNIYIWLHHYTDTHG